MITSIKPVVVKLDCHHQVETVPQDNWSTPVLCWICPGKPARHVVAVWEFCRVKCVTCQYYKGSHGFDAKRTAERRMYGHSRSNASHIVQLWQGGSKIDTTTLKLTQPELPLFELPPPF